MGSDEETSLHTGGSEPPDAVLNRIEDPVFGLDAALQITYVNDSALTMLGGASDESLTRDGIVGRSVDDLPVLAETNVLEQFRRAITEQETVTFEEYVAPLEGWLTARVYPSESALSVCVRNFSQEQHRRDQLADRVDVMRKVYDVISDRSRPFEERVEALLNIAAAELDIPYGALTRIRDEEYELRVLNATDLSVGPGYELPLDEVFCERTVREQETLVLSDVTSEAPEFTDRVMYEELGMTCYIGTPVIVDGEIYGSICLCDTESRERAFADWEVTLVDLIGQWISYTLERRQVEERLSHQNERLEKFASIVSHDLRNPLTLAAGNLELVAETTDSEALVEVERAHDRMETIISDILTMARQGDPVEDLEPIDLVDVGDRAWSTVETEAAALEIETGIVYADRSRLQQLLENLIRNSVEHNSTSSQDETRPDDNATSDQRVDRAGDAVEDADADITVRIGPLPDRDGFYLEDDGEGIPPEDRDQALEFGYTTSEDGTGFGLAIVQQIAEAHGWSLTIASSDNDGVRFEFDTETAARAGNESDETTDGW